MHFMEKEQLKNNLIRNLEIERTRRGISQAEMAKKLQMSTSNYTRMISGEAKSISAYTSYLIAYTFDQTILNLMGVKDKYMNITEKLKGLTDQQLKIIESHIDFEAAFSEQKKAITDSYIDVYVPVGNMEDGMIYNSSNIIRVEASAYRKKYGDMLHCGIKITSNHLHPVYHTGDILLISKRPIRDGDTGLFIHQPTGRIYIRNFRQANPAVLEPINNFGVPIYVDNTDINAMNQWIKFGCVLTMMRS